jgi:hypothetical protein
MAFSAAAAQAENEFLLLNPGKTFNEEKAPEVKITGEQVGAGRLIVPAKKIEIVCQKVDVLNGAIIVKEVEIEKVKVKLAKEGEATLLYLECVTWTIKIGAGKHEYTLETQLTKCILPGNDITAKGRLVPLLHNGEAYLEAEGTLGAEKLFATLQYEAGKGCILPTEAIKVKGEVCIQIDQSNQSPQHLKLSPTITLLLQETGLPGFKLLYGENEAYVEGEATAKITAPEAFVNAAFGAH